MEAPSVLPAPTTPAAPPANANNVTSPDDESAKRKRQPRNSACQPCASLKMKCVPSPVPGKCERCHRMNRECVAAIPKVRKRRTESNVGTDFPSGNPPFGVLSGNASANTDTNTTVQRPLPNKPVTIEPSYLQDSLLSRSDIRHNGSKSFSALLAQGLELDTAYILPGDLLHGLDYNTTQTSFTVFRQLSTSFPFVHVNPAEDAVLLAAQRPFTVLAISTVTASSNPAIQARLRHAVRLALSSKAIIEAERSVDLMVGLLIFLAWHHHYLEKQQIYQYLCLLSGMAEDLGLSGPNTHGPGATIERDRAFLGCYYLCSCLSQKAFNKPNPLRWSDNLRRCAENVARAGNLPTDPNLVAMTELAQALDNFNEELQATTALKQPAYVPSVEMHAKMTGNRLKSLKREHPSLSINVALAAAMIDTHQRRLNAAPDNASILIKCACDISEYIDDLLGRPPISMHQMAIVDWTNLLDILILMAKVSKSLPTTGGWEAGAMSSMLSPEAILDKLSAHIANAPKNDALAPRNENLMRWFQAFCGSVKRNVIYAQGKGLHPDARFNSVNTAPGTAPELSLPYASVSTPAAIGGLNFGVLDEYFLHSFMGPP